MAIRNNNVHVGEDTLHMKRPIEISRPNIAARRPRSQDKLADDDFKVAIPAQYEKQRKQRDVLA
jgi:hypothetical protein